MSSRNKRSPKKKRGGQTSRATPAHRAKQPTPAAEPEAPQQRESGDRRSLIIHSGLAIAAGCLWFTACADFDIWPFAWFAMVPVMFAIERARTRRRALFYGWLAGLVANAGGFYWISTLLERFANMPLVVGILGLLVLAAYQAIVFWLFAMTVRSLRNGWRQRYGRPLPMTLVAPIAMVSFELLVPFLFPWYLAITQAWVPPVIQIAELTGPLGVTALLMIANGAIYDVLHERGSSPNNDWRQQLLPGAVGGTVIAAALVFGFVRMAQIDDKRADAVSLKVGIVQGNIPFNEKGIDRHELAARQLRGLQGVSERLEADGAELIVWTESSHPYPIERSATADLPIGDPGRVRRDFRSPVIVGAVTHDLSGPTRRAWNTAIMIDSSDQFVGRFDKIFLLLFGEYTPLAGSFEWIGKIMPPAASQFERGRGVTTFPLEHRGQEYRLAPMICYEDILTDFNRKIGKLRPHLLVNVTNDAWFGETSEPWEHLALSVYRAVELRTDMVRAVNTGVSAIVDANGRVLQETYAIDPAVDRRPASGLLGDVVLMEGGDGFFIRFGDIFGYGCVGGVLGLFALLWFEKRKRARSAPHS